MDHSVHELHALADTAGACGPIAGYIQRDSASDAGHALPNDLHDAQSIAAFYAHCRDYWVALGRSAEGDTTGMLNFGYWAAGQNNLFEAQRHFAAQLRALLPPASGGMRGLEIGCGIGGVSIDLLKHKPHLTMTGVDISPNQLAVAKQNAQAGGVSKRLHLELGDSMALPFVDASFDVALCIESSFHYEDKTAFFSECFRVLKPGGYAIVADITCSDNAQVKLRRGNHFASTQDYVALARSAGFDVPSVKDIGVDVYAPLLASVTQFNRETRMPSGKYWSVVLRNYAALAQQGLMGYVIFLLTKPL